MEDVKAVLIKRNALSKNAVDFALSVGRMADTATPGQFVTVACGEERLLRRPLSICDAEPGVIRVVFEVRGEGTKWLSERREGDTLKVLGPLGNGFRLNREDGLPALFVGGGIGVPPIYFAAKRFAGECDAVIGFRNKDAVILHENMKKVSNTVTVCTDDGSCGECGFTTDIADRLLGQKKYGAVYACGPAAMLREVARLSEIYHVPCQISLEERMGCGVGACLVCACAVRTKEGTEYKHVCRDGPVFDASEVLF